MQFESTTTAIIAIALGAAVLFLGKNLRFFAAAAGFFIGISFITALFPGQVLAGLILGVALAVLFVILLGIGIISGVTRTRRREVPAGGAMAVERERVIERH